MANTSSPLRERFEFLVVCCFCLALGTLVAISTVIAQDKDSKIAKTTVAGCEPAKSPDAMCTIAIKNEENETKLCLGTHHPRCFELKGKSLTQSMRGTVIRTIVLDDTQGAEVKSIIHSYAEWLESAVGTKKNRFFSCQNAVLIDANKTHKEFCLSALPKKEVDTKTSDVIAKLEFPGARTSK